MLKFLDSHDKITYQGEGYPAYDNPEFRDENGIIDHGKNNSVGDGENGSRKKRDSLLHGLLHRRSNPLEATKSTESLNSVQEIINVALQSQDFTGLGFNIHGNMRDGIFVKEVLSRGPAKDCGKVQAGDRILKVTISFKNMVFEDALTILSYASPYAVTLDLQKLDPKTSSATARKLSQTKPSSKSNRKAQLHPLFKSHSIDDITLSKDLSDKGSFNNRHQLIKDTRRTKSVQENNTGPPAEGQKSIAKLSMAAMESIKEEGPKSPGASAVITTTAEVENSSTKSAQLSPAAPLRQKDGIDPYADLTPEERMQVLRLSYEDTDLSQSTPNLSQISLTAEVLEPSDTEGKVSPEHQKLERARKGPNHPNEQVESSDTDSIDLNAAKQKLEARKALLVQDSIVTTDRGPLKKKDHVPKDFEAEKAAKVRPPPPNGIEFETFEVTSEAGNPAPPPTLPQTPPPPLGPKSPPRSARVPNGTPKAASSPQSQERVILSPAMEKSNWLRPVQTTNENNSNDLSDSSDLNSRISRAARRQMTGTMSMPTSDDDQSALRMSAKIGGLGQSLDGGGQESEFDAEQYKKLLYFQQQLAKQHEELTKMGIHIPMSLGPLKQGQGPPGPTNGEILSNGVH